MPLPLLPDVGNSLVGTPQNGTDGAMDPWTQRGLAREAARESATPQNGEHLNGSASNGGGSASRTGGGNAALAATPGLSPKTSFSSRATRSRSPVRPRSIYGGNGSPLRRVDSEDELSRTQEIQRLREQLKQYQDKEKEENKDDDAASQSSGKDGQPPYPKLLRNVSRDQSFAEWVGNMAGSVTHAVVKKSSRALGLKKMKATSAEAIYNKRLHLVGTIGIVCALYGALFFSIGPEAMFIGDGGKGWALFLIWVSATLGGAIMAKLGLPSLLGMLGSGILLTNVVPGGLVYMLPESWAAAIRAFGLCVILMRSGLEMDVTAIKRIGLVALRLTCCPGAANPKP